MLSLTPRELEFMQQKLPELENDVQKALVDYISGLANSGSPLAANIGAHKLSEGRTSSIVRENNEREAIENR